MLQLSVTRDEAGKTGAQNISVSNVLFLQMVEKRVFVHTLDDHFYLSGTLTYWQEALKAVGYDFEMVDRNIVVNMPKIKRLDRFFSFAYFEDEISKESKKITLAQKYVKKLLTNKYHAKVVVT